MAWRPRQLALCSAIAGDIEKYSGTIHFYTPQIMIHWMNSNEGVAAWAQALGGVAAVIAAFLFPLLQSRSGRRSVELAVATALREIAVDSTDAVRALIKALEQPHTDDPKRQRRAQHPRLLEFFSEFENIRPRILAILQNPAASNEQVSELVEIQRCLKDAMYLFETAREPYYEFDTPKKDQAYAILNRSETLCEQVHVELSTLLILRKRKPLTHFKAWLLHKISQ